MAYSPTFSTSSLTPSYASFATDQGGILDSYSPTTVLSKLGEPLLYIVRHAEVAQDKENVIRGLVNPSLDEKGRKTAAMLVDFFADIPLSAIYVDDLARTIETIQPLADSKGLIPQVDLRLRSWDVGSDLEEQPIKDNEDYIVQLRANPEQVPVGGQPWGEFKDQINSSFRDHVSEAMSAPCAVCLVTHGSGIQVIWKELGEDVPDEYAEIPVEPGGAGAVYLTREGLKVKTIEGEGENADE